MKSNGNRKSLIIFQTSYFCRKRLQSQHFWNTDSPNSIRMRIRLFRKAEEVEREYVEKRQEILRVLRAAKGRAETKKTSVKKTKFQLDKALAGYL